MICLIYFSSLLREYEDIVQLFQFTKPHFHMSIGKRDSRWSPVLLFQCFHHFIININLSLSSMMKNYLSLSDDSCSSFWYFIFFYDRNHRSFSFFMTDVRKWSNISSDMANKFIDIRKFTEYHWRTMNADVDKYIS